MRTVAPKNFFAELKRRNVYRAAVAYGVVAWFLTQLTTQVFPFFEIPNSAVRFVVIALAVGFPIAMLLSWIYELTPEGVVRTEDLDPVEARSVQRRSGRLLDFIIIGALLLVIAMLVVGRLPFYRETGESISQKSIAVLPFENLSEDKANAYFADGIQEEILTRLSRIADLKVISRTSTHRFKNSPDAISQIAKQLGVANIVEGTVQKAADQVRVNVQLIDAENDSHLWAERYDRKLTDIFAVESDIASKIAEALQAKLTGTERRAISSHPTKNTEAHQLYLKGRYHWRNFFGPGYEKVRDYFQQAIELDPNYAAAYAGLSLYHSFGAANGILPPPEHWPPAESAVKKALSLDNTLAEAYNPLAAVEIYYKRDWSAAERAFRRGMELDPNFADIPHHYGICLALFGRNDEAVAQMERATQLDPFFPGLNLHRGRLFFFLRDYDRAIKEFAKTLELHPGYPTAHEWFGDACEKKGMAHEAITQWCSALTLNGEPEHARILEQTYAISGFDAALRALAQKQLQRLDERTAQGDYVPAWHYLMACVRLGDNEQAFAWLAKTVEERNWFPFQVR